MSDTQASPVRQAIVEAVLGALLGLVAPVVCWALVLYLLGL
jgi:hypothetical protein